MPLETAAAATHLKLAPKGTGHEDRALTSVALFEQGLTQVLQASITGLEPNTLYYLALSESRDGQGPVQTLSKFTTNQAGAAIVNAVGPIRQIVEATRKDERRYLVIATVADGKPTNIVQVQLD